jgi:pyruvate kinase
MPFQRLDAAPDPKAPQLVATLGPASLNQARTLAEAGATALRLNASHLSPAALVGAVERVRRELPGAPVVVDLQGAKMRLGEVRERAVHAGDRVRFVLPPASASVAPLPGAVPLPHPELFAAVHPGDTLSNDDDRLTFRIAAIEPGELTATCLAGGRLRPRTGVNLIEHPVTLEDLTPPDAARVHALRAFHGPDLAFAFSFMTDGREAAWLRQRAPGSPVVGKVERREAVAGLKAVTAAVDAVWVCRGDLGAQLGPAALARFVAGYTPAGGGRPVLMAGQVLEQLTHHAVPTRSEVCHVHDLLARGYAGIVLSDETAIGDDPVRAVTEAAALLRALTA